MNYIDICFIMKWDKIDNYGKIKIKKEENYHLQEHQKESRKIKILF